MTTRPNTRSTGPPEPPQLTHEQLNELNVHRELRQLLNGSLPISQRQTSPVPNPRVDHTYRRQVSLPPSSKISLQHFMDSSDQPSTTNASLAVEPSTLIGSPQLNYRPNTSTGTPNEQTERLRLTGRTSGRAGGPGFKRPHSMRLGSLLGAQSACLVRA